MRRGTVAAILGASVLALAAAGYVVLDGRDLAPGVVTAAGAVRPADPPTLSAQSGQPVADPAQSEGAPVSASAVEAAWGAAQAAAADGKWRTWAHVVDASTGDVLLDSGGSQAHTPASITKVLSAFTALAHLDPSARLSTGTSLQGTDLYLWGQGDLLLGEGAGNPATTNGHAGVGDLANLTATALKDKGVTRVVLHPATDLFAGESHLGAWAGQEVANYEGHVGAMAVDSGRVNGDSMNFVPDPELSVAEILAAHLRSAGVEVEMAGAAAAPASATELARVDSATLAQQIRYFLQESDNTMADQYCRLAAHAAGAEPTYAGATALVLKDLTAGGVSVEGMTLEDCSGLSTNDKIPGSVLTGAIRASLASDRPALADLARSLPWAGLQGTMHNRLEGASTAGNVQAKTGSLAAVSSLAGVVTTSSGRTLVFAVGNDGVPDDAAALTRPHLDNFVAALAAL
ncbi:D-alanyl-D-alanine carboxypeptidase/D-alanyl-D-alanine-endopeptidase [Schaalia sp. 19OD2882]|uniref:D-alanyl-D-alanine carboxypeptidase/D-alanyl-D-alanine endopeptidase n=1 Tax=Schaalia sp. 19OD2882 TaxID=2794089 RepID=UPI001C1EE7E8|nr:D-alanyl-D-alanine carboxypeptidase/D-alanyl-D-alanine-endopeptidase [Schaalia sp. 19OD2882]QWW19856.1 D-alanyl-D-alanine carboxypeptidase/D-alanyl-D-alanine-endopeptidase [Schaalia sp. 19OD2882]